MLRWIVMLIIDVEMGGDVIGDDVSLDDKKK